MITILTTEREDALPLGEGGGGKGVTSVSIGNKAAVEKMKAQHATKQAAHNEKVSGKAASKGEKSKAAETKKALEKETPQHKLEKAQKELDKAKSEMVKARNDVNNSSVPNRFEKEREAEKRYKEAYAIKAAAEKEVKNSQKAEQARAKEISNLPSHEKGLVLSGVKLGLSRSEYQSIHDKLSSQIETAHEQERVLPAKIHAQEQAIGKYLDVTRNNKQSNSPKNYSWEELGNM